MSKFEESFEKAMRAAERIAQSHPAERLVAASAPRQKELGHLPPRDEGFEWVSFDSRGHTTNLQRGFSTIEAASRAAQAYSKKLPKSNHVDVFRDILRGDSGPKLARFRAGKPNPGTSGEFSIGDHVRVHGQSFYKGMAGTVEQYVPIGKYSIRWDHAGRDVVPGSVLAHNPGLGHHRKPGPDLFHYSPGAASRPGKVKVHETERYTRVRLHDPSEFEPGSFRTIDPGRPGHTKLIVGRPKGSKKMRVQAILKSRS